MKKLHPGAKWVFRFRAYFTLIFLEIFATIWLFPFLLAIFGFSFETSDPGSIVNSLLIYAIAYLIFIFVVGEVYTRMAYNRWMYEFTDTQLRIERGIIWKRYSNMPYARVQNVDITRGILARILGFSSVNIQTAGYSYSGRGMPSSEGYLPAVSAEEAEKIREFLMKKIGKKSGL